MKRHLFIIYLMATWLQVQAQTDSLQTYILAALRDNPEVTARQRAYEAALQTVCPAGTLGDPELSVNFYPKPMTQVNGRQVMSVSLMQMFPWFGTMKASKHEKAWQAETVWQQYREAGIQLAYEVEQKWYDMLVTRENLQTTLRHLKLLKDIQDVAVYQYKNSTNGMKGSKMSDQYRLEAEQLKLEEQKESLASRLQLQQGQFNLLLHRQPASPLVLPDSIQLAEMPQAEWSEIEQQAPNLLALRAQKKQYAAQGDKARRMGYPMVGLGIQYMLNRERSDGMAMPDMNGMDMWMGMMKVTLPIFRHKIKAQRRAASLMQQTADETYQRQVDVLHSKLLDIRQRADDIRRKMTLYQNDMNILARTLQLMQQEYATGSTTLTDILQTAREQLNFAFLHAQSRAQYNMTVADMEKLASVRVSNNKQTHK